MSVKTTYQRKGYIERCMDIDYLSGVQQCPRCCFMAVKDVMIDHVCQEKNPYEGPKQRAKQEKENLAREWEKLSKLDRSW